MDILSAVIAGLIQGATEFLPVSSSGHLALYHAFFGGGQNVAFDVFLHLGTLAAVCAVYRKDVIKLIHGFFTGSVKLITGKAKYGFEEYERLAFYVITATVPVVIAALLGAGDSAEAAAHHPLIIGAALICSGFVLLFSEKTGGGSKDLSGMKTKNALFIGLCQAAAIFPGLSRSGCTVSGGLVQKFDRGFAVKFSFLISIPAIIGANVLKIPEAVGQGALAGDIPSYVCGFIAAAVSGLFAIKLLIFVANKAKLSYFSCYCFALGSAAIIYETINLI